MKFEFLRDVDLLLKIRHQELKVWCLANIKLPCLN